MKFFIQFFLCGILTGLLFPPFFLIPLGFIIFPYLFTLLKHKEYLLFNYRRHFLSGFFYGLGFFYIYLGWIKEPFLHDNLTKNFAVLSYFLVVYCSLYFGFIFLILKYFNQTINKLIMFPVLIITGEFFCANLSFGFPWFSFSLVHSGNIFGLSTIFFLGTYGLSFITIFIFLLPSIFLLNNSKLKKIFYVIVFIFLINLFLLIIFRNKEIDSSYNEELNVSLVQLNFPIGQKLSLEQSRIRLDYILDIIKINNSDILIFGENNYPFIIDNFNNLIYFQRLLKPKTNLIIGATRKDKDKYYNSLFLINKKKIEKFDKQILVPFGEFVPFRKFFSFMEFIAGTTDFSVGNDKRNLDLNNNNKFIPIICYEIIYFWKLLNTYNHDSDFIINLTNDSWFGKLSGPYQHFYFTRLRAAEFNKYLIRVSNNGISAIINNYGHIIDFIELEKQKTKTIKISISNNKTNNIKMHQIITLLIFLTLIIGILLEKKNDS